jgi:hypothetical protein
MTSRNDITGDSLTSKPSSDAYRNNFDAIFRKKPTKPEYGRGTLTVAVMTEAEKLKHDSEALITYLREEGRLSQAACVIAYSRIMVVLPVEAKLAVMNSKAFAHVKEANEQIKTQLNGMITERDARYPTVDVPEGSEPD